MLAGPDLAAFDLPGSAAEARRQRFATGESLNAEHRQVLKLLGELSAQTRKLPLSQHLKFLRRFMDSLSEGHTLTARFVPVDAGGVKAEWVLAPGADSSRRTLYIHGGAWAMGSPLSHRVITNKFSELTGGAVLAIDYRLMPEHPRRAGIEDCRTAYRWILDNGPEGPQPVSALVVAGDSAGGNLTLSTVAWARDQQLRPANAVVALSPATDGTMSGKTLKSNLATDAMLGPLFAPLTRLPHSALLWLTFLLNRQRPCNPVLSPIHGDLAGLPPVLIQASEDEMLLDDAQRYQNKALAAGSPVTLQTWRHVVHVWHMFDPQLSEARQAFEQIGQFLQRCLPAPQHK
ncbi:alpha/beta hydrolase [Pseudomonas sp. N040]|nr:alpha/beta hydrolase [Pseudomonas sp. N040]